MKGVCAFDIDQTLTCGEYFCNDERINTILRTIHICKQHDMGVVINTARPPQNDILFNINEKILKALGPNIEVYDMKRNNYNVPLNKLTNNRLIAQNHNVDFEKVILIDDRPDTCDYINNMGGTAILVEDKESGFGISPHEVNILTETLKNF